MEHDILVDLYSIVFDYAVASRNRFVLNELRKSVTVNIERSVLERLWEKIRYRADSMREEATLIYRVVEETERCIRKRSLIRVPARLNWPQYVFEEFLAVTEAIVREVNTIYYGVTELLKKGEPDNAAEALTYADELYHYANRMERVRRGLDALRDAAKYICEDDVVDFIVHALSETAVMIGGYRRLDPAVLTRTLELRPVLLLEELYPVARGLRDAMVKHIVEYIGETLAPA